jgi:hypothetical protein
VNQSHAAIWPENSKPPRPIIASRMNSTVTSNARAAVTNITGLRIIFAGASLVTASMAACRAIWPSRIEV